MLGRMAYARAGLQALRLTASAKNAPARPSLAALPYSSVVLNGTHPNKGV